VKGATLLVSMTHPDSRVCDGLAHEAARYGDQRDDMGRPMPVLMGVARGELVSEWATA
jgi:hypothetical protein